MEKRYRYAVIVSAIAVFLVLSAALLSMTQARSAEQMVLTASDLGSDWEQPSDPQPNVAGDAASSNFRSVTGHRTVNCEVRLFNSTADAKGHFSVLKEDIGYAPLGLEPVANLSLGDECVVYKSQDSNGLFVAILLKGTAVAQLYYTTALELEAVSLEVVKDLMTAQAAKIY